MTSTAPTDVPLDLVRGNVVIAGRPILRDVSLRVEPGQFVALMGANGSGKSTLVRALVGLLPLSSGELTIFGNEARGFRSRRRIGYVPQRTSAVSGVPASVWEVVAAGRLTHRRPFRRLSKVDRRIIDEALAQVGLADRGRDSISALSGGQQQRALIARALVGEPDLFILDEPTAGVDLPNQVALADALGHLKRSGAAVLLVAHELGPLAPLVDRSVVLQFGQVIHDGPPLSDQDVHSFGEAHTHHHLSAAEALPDRSPAIHAPLEGRR